MKPACLPEALFGLHARLNGVKGVSIQVQVHRAGCWVRVGERRRGDFATELAGIWGGSRSYDMATEGLCVTRERSRSK